MDIILLKSVIDLGKTITTPHAYNEATAEQLNITEIRVSVVNNGLIIEDYPHDPRGASCLILSLLPDNCPVHSCWGYQAATGQAILITVYRPDNQPGKWSPDWRSRHRPQP